MPVIFSVVIKYFTEAFLPVIDRLFSRGRLLVPVFLTQFDQHINSDCLISVRRHMTVYLLSLVSGWPDTGACAAASVYALKPGLWWSEQCGYTGYSYTGYTGYTGYSGYRGDYNGITIGLHFQLSPGLMWQSEAGYIFSVQSSLQIRHGSDGWGYCMVFSSSVTLKVLQNYLWMVLPVRLSVIEDLCG